MNTKFLRMFITQIIISNRLKTAFLYFVPILTILSDFFDSGKNIYQYIFTFMIMKTKRGSIGRYAIFFFTIFCGVFFMLKSDSHLLLKNNSGKYSQKTDNQISTSVFNLFDIQEGIVIDDDLNQPLFDINTLFEEWSPYTLNLHFYSSHSVIIATHNYSYITLPRYIFFHSLRIPSC